MISKKKIFKETKNSYWPTIHHLTNFHFSQTKIIKEKKIVFIFSLIQPISKKRSRRLEKNPRTNTKYIGWNRKIKTNKIIFLLTQTTRMTLRALFTWHFKNTRSNEVYALYTHTNNTHTMINKKGKPFTLKRSNIVNDHTKKKKKIWNDIYWQIAQGKSLIYNTNIHEKYTYWLLAYKREKQNPSNANVFHCERPNLSWMITWNKKKT